MSKQAIKDNAQHIAGMLIGLTMLRITGLRFGKEFRSSRWFSTVSANLTADGIRLPILMYR